MNHLEINVENNLNFINIYNNITSLKIHEVPFITLQKILGYVEYFERMESLSVLKTVRGRYEEDAIVDLGFLKDFSKLKNLKNIDFAINLSLSSAFETFLQSFSLPKKFRKSQVKFL